MDGWKDKKTKRFFFVFLGKGYFYTKKRKTQKLSNQTLSLSFKKLLIVEKTVIKDHKWDIDKQINSVV